MQRPPARLAGLLVAAVLAVVLCVAFRAPLARAVVAAAIDLATGDRMAFGALELAPGRIVARDLSVERAGRPLFEARAADVRYRLRDLFPGGAHRYGLVSVDLQQPQLTVLRYADGSFNLPGTTPAGAAPQVGPADPLAFSGTVQGGRVVLLDPGRIDPAARTLSLDGLAGHFDVSTAGRSSYLLRGHVGFDPLAAFTLKARVDAGGYVVASLRARRIAPAALLNYLINSKAARVLDGSVRDLDVRAYGFAPAAGAAPAYHLAGGLQLAGGALRVPGLALPATGIAGSVDLFDNGMAAPHLTARLGGIDVRLAGGLIGWKAPAFRLGIVAARAPLGSARRLFVFSRRLPLRGDARFATFLEGAVGSPLIATRFTAPQLTYGAFPVSAASGRVLYSRGSVDVVDARGVYGGLLVRAHGAIVLGAPAPLTQLVVGVSGLARSVPYLAQAAPLAGLAGGGLLAGAGLRLDARGAVTGAGGGTAYDGVFHVDPYGEGTLGPFALRGPLGASLEGAYFLNRAASRSGFWLDARSVPMRDLGPGPRLPGVALAPPAFSGRLDGAFAGEGPPSHFRVAGRVAAGGLRVGAFQIDRVEGDLAGAVGNLRLGRVAARGPWGFFEGAGAYARSDLALVGHYGGTFEALRTLTGDLGARGPVDGPVALLIDPSRTIVQARDERTPGASVHGVPVDRFAGTLAVHGGRLRIFAGTAAVGGGTLATAGSLEDGRLLGVSVADAQTARLRALVPLDGGGRVAAIGSVRMTARTPRFDGGITVEDAGVARLALAGNGDVTFGGSRLDVRAADARVGAALGSLAGSVSAVGTGAPRYDVRVHVAAARLAPFARAVAPRRRDIVGSVQADVRVRGTPATLGLAGVVSLPEGSVNGLAFRDATARLTIDRSGLAARRGRVTVGSTRARFGGLVRGDDLALHLNAPQADLADFNDYFDAGDTLGGHGRIAARFVKRRGTVRTNADVAIAGLRYRRFELGSARAVWSSRGSDVTGNVAFGGTSGRLQAAGTLRLASGAALSSVLARSRFAGRAQLRDLDLGTWLPALGYALPLTGRVDADATMAGALRNPDIQTDATLVGGSIGKFPVNRLVLSAASSLRRTTIRTAELDLPLLRLALSGTIGSRASDPVALALHGMSPDIGPPAARLFGASYPVSGSAEADVTVAGTRGHPVVTGGFDFEKAAVRGVAIPRALGQFNLRGRDVVLSSVEIGFATGAVYFAGSVPLQIAPLGLGPEHAPLALDVSAKGLDLGNFAPLLPAGSTLKGVMDGRVDVGGTVGAPRLGGSLTVARGQLRSPLETVPLTEIGARLSFAGSETRLDAFHANAGGGTLDATGAVRFTDLTQSAKAGSYRLDARASRLRLDLPAYGSGQVDGTLSLMRSPGAAPLLAGALALSDATIPFSALLLAGGGDSGGFSVSSAAPAPSAGASDVDFDLALSALRNVRVRSANVDIGAQGQLHVGGTRSAPRLAGAFVSTGGTLAYFNTVFRLTDGTVTFEPDLGLIPTLAAHATTHVINPDPNAVRNLAGTADITLALGGPVTGLTIGLSSDPPYGRQQILGLLLNAPALGATNLFGENSQNPTLYGSNGSALPPGALANRSSSGELSVAQEAFGIANAQFTRALLAPIETSFASAVGLSSFNVNIDYTGNVGLTARKILGKKVNALYGTSFGYPYRQTFGFEIKPNDATAAQVTVFQTLGATGLNSLTPTTYLTTSNPKLQAAQPTSGEIGFSLSFQRLFP